MNEAHAWLPFIALVKRDLLIHLRRRSSGVSLILMVGVAVLLVWFGTELGPASRGFGRTLLGGGMYLLYLVSLLRVTTIAALAIVSERERNTLEQLYLSHLGPGAIVAAKTISAVGYFLLMCIGILPVFGVVFFYVGVDIFQFVSAVAVLFAATFAHAGIGLAVSASSATPTRAMLRAGLHVGLWSMGIAFVICLAPLSMLTSPLAGIGMAFSPGFGSPGFIIVPIGFQLAICFIALTRAKSNLQRAMTEEPRIVNPPRVLTPVSPATPPPLPSVPPPLPTAYATSAAVGPGLPVSRPMYPESPAIRWIEDNENPITVKEYPSSRPGPITWAKIARDPVGLPGIILLLFCLWMLVFSGMSASGQSRNLLSTVYFYAGVAVSLLAPLAVAVAINKERNAPTFQMLTLSLLSPWEIVWGHLRPVLLRAIAAYVLLTAIGVVIMILLVKDVNLENHLHLLKFAAGLVQIPVLCAMGALAGVFANSTMRAVGLAFLFALLYAGLPTLLNPVAYVFGNPQGWEDLAARLVGFFMPSLWWTLETFATASPVVCIANILYQLALFALLLGVTVRVLAQLQRAGSGLERLLNRALNPGDF